MSNEIKIKKRGEGLKKFLKKYGYFIALGIVVLIVALSVILTGKPVKNTDIVVTDKEPIEVGSVALSFGLPLSNCQVVHDYSRDALIYNETMGWFETHKGVDLKSENSQDVLACEGGEVVKIYTNNLEGTVIVIKHDDHFSSKYSSLNSNVSVKIGDKVLKGQKIGEVSASAGEEVETGAHLHFELIKDNTQVNPNDYLTLQNK